MTDHPKSDQGDSRFRDAILDIEEILGRLPAHEPYREKDVAEVKRAWEIARGLGVRRSLPPEASDA